ncbi:Uncharacterised protein [Vibrio cholerae]|nr:Uncharacterised protein [Vibrio cholerae]
MARYATGFRREHQHLQLLFGGFFNRRTLVAGVKRFFVAHKAATHFVIAVALLVEHFHTESDGL